LRPIGSRISGGAERAVGRPRADSTSSTSISIAQSLGRTNRRLASSAELGSERRLRYTIGQYPTLTLAVARAEARKLLAEFTLGKTSPQVISYKKAVEQFIEEKEKARRKSTANAYKGLLNRLPFEDQVTAITHEEVARKLRRITTQGAYNHHLVALKVFFNWCIKRQYRTDNPTLGLSKFARPKKKRILSDDELKAIWQAADKCGTFGAIVKLLMLTGQRRNEIAALKHSHVEGDLLCLPPELTKNGRAHVLPLCSMTKSKLPMPKLSDSSSLFFPTRGRNTPFSAWSKSKKNLDNLSGVTDYTLHDFRRTMRTGLGHLGVRPDIAECILNHVSARSEVEDICDHHLYLGPMREALRLWEQHLLALVSANAAAA